MIHDAQRTGVARFLQQRAGDAAAALPFVDGEQLDPAARGGHDADQRRALPGAEDAAFTLAVVAEQLLLGDEVDAIVGQCGRE